MFTQSIARAIKERWPEAAVYDDTVKQYLKKEGFVILTNGTVHTPRLAGAHTLRQSYAVYYYPAVGAEREELEEIGRELFSVLEEITLAPLVYRAVEMTYRIVEHALLFQATYEYRERPLREETRMETLRQEHRTEG